MIMHDPIQVWEDLRPGDIMFGPITGPVGFGVGLGQLLLRESFRVGGLSVRHVAIVTQAYVAPYRQKYPDGRAARQPVMVEAMPGGARRIEVTAGQRWDETYAYVRLPEDYEGQAQDAALIADMMVAEGVGYSFASYLALAAWRFRLRASWLERWIDRRRDPIQFYGTRTTPREIRFPVEAICSVLVDQAWSLAGKRVVEGVAHQAVTPGHMADQLLTRPGVSWCIPWPGLSGNATSWTVD